MISGIGSESGAVAAANVFLRELGVGRQGKGPASTNLSHSVERAVAIGGKSELTEAELRQVEELKQRDREVHRHESAHKAAAGSYARGGPSFEYTTGPDGRRYATGGEVQIDVSEISGDPEATLRKMQQVRRAASAPAEPSSQDRQISAKAAQIEARARAELADKTRDAGGDERGRRNTAATKPTASIAFAAHAPGRLQPGALIDVFV